jgi:uncharacterized protein (DUF1778 family)
VSRRRLGRPPLPKGERRVRVDLRLSPNTVRLLDEIADRKVCTRTDAVEIAIVRFAERFLRARRKGVRQ